MKLIYFLLKNSVSLLLEIIYLQTYEILNIFQESLLVQIYFLMDLKINIFLKVQFTLMVELLIQNLKMHPFIFLIMFLLLILLHIMFQDVNA